MARLMLGRQPVVPIMLIAAAGEQSDRRRARRVQAPERQRGKLVKEFVCVSGAGGSRYCLLYAMPAP